MGEAEEGAGPPPPLTRGACLHNHWDQCVIYLETTEIYIPGASPPQLQPGLHTPGTELVSELGLPGVGWAGWALPSRLLTCPQVRPLVYKGDPAQTYLLTC